METKITAAEAIVEARMLSHRRRFEEDRVTVYETEGGYLVFGRYERPADLGYEQKVGTWSGGCVWDAGPRYTKEMTAAVKIDPRRG